MLVMKKCFLVSIFSLVCGFNSLTDHNEEVVRYKKFEKSVKWAHYLIHSNYILYSCPIPAHPAVWIAVWKASCLFNKFNRFSCFVSAMAWGKWWLKRCRLLAKRVSGYCCAMDDLQCLSVFAFWCHMRWLRTPQETVDLTGINMWKIRGH